MLSSSLKRLELTTTIGGDISTTRYYTLIIIHNTHYLRFSSSSKKANLFTSLPFGLFQFVRPFHCVFRLKFRVFEVIL